MLSIPNKATDMEKRASDLSSICNYNDYEGVTPTSKITGETSMMADEQAFEYRDEAIPFITIDEETSKWTL